MDDIDLANQHADMLRNIQIQQRKHPGPAPTGRCLWCEEVLEDKTHRWCDQDCRDDYEQAEKNAPHLIP